MGLVIINFSIQKNATGDEMNLGMRMAFSLVIFSILMLIVQTSAAEEQLCNESSSGQSWSSNKVHALPKEETQILITIKLYVHEGGKNGPMLSGVTVVAKDDADASYGGTTLNGYLVIKGKPGIWVFTISRDDFEPETTIESIFVSGRVDIYFSDKSQDARQEIESELSVPSPPGNLNSKSSVSPYSEDFDLRDMKGFKDNVISSDEIESFIQAKASTSPMLSEPYIGECFVNAGQNNNVNPAFLVAVACSESGFGTRGWTIKNPESHNSLGYGVDSEDMSSDAVNSADSWCAMVNRVAIVIAKGNSLYNRNLFSVAQVYTKYSKNVNFSPVVSLMNELYSFSSSSGGGYTFQSLAQPISQELSPPTQKEAIELSGYRPTYKPSQSGYRPTYIPKVTSSAKETVQLG
jgi:hypothetical protein